MQRNSRVADEANQRSDSAGCFGTEWRHGASRWHRDIQIEECFSVCFLVLSEREAQWISASGSVRSAPDGIVA